MPRYRVRDARTGLTFTVEGEGGPPSEAELEALASQHVQTRLNRPLEARGLRRGLQDVMSIAPLAAAGLRPAAMGIQAVIGAGSEFIRQSAAGEPVSLSKIGAGAASGALAGATGKAAGLVGRGVMKVGARVKQAMAPLTDRAIRDIANAFRVPREEAQRVFGRWLAARGLHPTRASIERLQREVKALQQSKRAVLRQTPSTKMIAPQEPIRTARQQIQRGPLGQQATPQRDLEAFERVARDFRAGPRVTRKVQLSRPGPPQQSALVGPTGQPLPPTPTTITETVRRSKPVSPAVMEDIKAKTGRTLKQKARFSELQTGETEAQKALMGGIRRAVERRVPAIKPLNRQQAQAIVGRNVLSDIRKLSGRRGGPSIPEFVGLVTGKPALLGVAALGRPGVASAAGQTVFRAGQAIRSPAIPMAARLGLSGAQRDIEEALQRLRRQLAGER